MDWGVRTYAIFDAIASSAEYIVLEIEDLKPGVEIFDKLADLDRPSVVS